MFRQLRHDLATPLSGAALHLEVACRRLTQGADRDASRVLENVRMGQLEVGYASAMLEVLTEVVRSGDEDGVPFSLTRAVADGVAQVSSGSSRGIAIEAPVVSPNPVVFGTRRQLEQAVSDMTFHAVQACEPPSRVSWQIEQLTGEVRLLCRWPGRLPDGRPEQLFSLTRGPLGESRGLGLLLARWAVESQGGELTAAQDGDESLFVARLPIGESKA